MFILDDDFLDSQVTVIFCYQCDKPVAYLFEDGRCLDCTRLTAAEVQGVVYFDIDD